MEMVTQMDRLLDLESKFLSQRWVGFFASRSGAQFLDLSGRNADVWFASPCRQNLLP